MIGKIFIFEPLYYDILINHDKCFSINYGKCRIWTIDNRNVQLLLAKFKI